MKVKMLVDTRYNGLYLKWGTMVEVDDAAGKRWIDRRIAVLEQKQKEQKTKDPGATQS